MEKINLNHEYYINLGKYGVGTTKLEVKISRTTYLVEVKKNALDTFIEFYSRDSKSKYDAKIHEFEGGFKNDALIDANTLFNLNKIRECKYFLRKYNSNFKD